MVLGLTGSNSIKVKLESEKDCVQTYSVEVPASKVKEAVEKAYQSIQNQAKLPGFRPGKTPLDMIRQTFQGTAHAHAQDDLLQDGVADALKQKNIKAVQRPVVQSVKFDPEHAFVFEFTVEVAPGFKLAPHKGLRLTRKMKPVEDLDVEKHIKAMLDYHAKLAESKSETVGKSHFVIINYEGFMDGKPIPDSKSENFLLDMSAPQSISGLTDGLSGAKVGEDREILVHFPPDSTAKEYADKDAQFKVKVIAIKEKIVPELNEDFAKEVGFESLDVMRRKVREKLDNDEEDRRRHDLEQQITDKLLEDNKFQVPLSLIEKQVETLVHRQRSRLSRQGIPEKDQSALLDGLKGDVRIQAEKDVRLAFILNAVSEHEKIDVTDEDVTKKIDEIVAKSHPNDRPTLEKTLRGSYIEQMRQDMRDSKLFDFLINVSKIKDISGGES